MKIIRIFKIRVFVLAATLSAGFGFVSPAFAFYYSDYASVIINPDGKVTYLGTLGGNTSTPTDINDSGQVVGYAATEDGSTHAFITGPNGVGMTDLGTLGGYRSQAFGINNSGQVVGVSWTGYSGRHAFITGPNGVGMTDLGTLGGYQSEAHDINNSGQVVGWAGIANNRSHAFITGPNGAGMTDLGTLPGYHCCDSRAEAINDNGQVVGSVAGSRVFITGPNGVGMTDLMGSLSVYQVYDINATGQVVGSFEVYPGFRFQNAFITGPGEFNIPSSSSAAYGINDAGQAVGHFETSDVHDSHASSQVPMVRPISHPMGICRMDIILSVLTRSITGGR